MISCVEVLHTFPTTMSMFNKLWLGSTVSVLHFKRKWSQSGGLEPMNYMLTDGRVSTYKPVTLQTFPFSTYFNSPASFREYLYVAQQSSHRPNPWLTKLVYGV